MKPKVKLRIVIGIVLTLLSFFSIPIVTVWKKSRVMEMAALNERLKTEAMNLKNEIVILKYSASRLGNRERIETIAKNECKLVFPENQTVTVIVKNNETEKSKTGKAGNLTAGYIR